MRLYLEALGLVTPLGRGKEAVAEGLFSGTRDGLVWRDDLLPARRIRVGAIAGGLPEIPARLRAYDCRNNRLALVALDEIARDIAEAIHVFGAARIGVVLGTSTSGIADGETALHAHRLDGAWPNGFTYTQQETGNAAVFAAAYLGLDGPAYTVTTACSSSAKAFASAQRLVDADLCDAVVVGGVDTLCRLTLHGFNALDSLAADHCNPFSRNRDGIMIGEGAAMFLLTPRPAPIALLGVGESSDAHHVSAPDPTGAGAMRAMRGALHAAGLPSEAVDYVNLHGTATPLNDAMEGRAVAEIFGTDTACSSTKALTGHLLGAAGAVEAAFLWLSLQPRYSDGRLPPHIWDGQRDPGIPPINLVAADTRLAITPRCAMISNSFAFGGSNAAVLLGRGW